MQKTQDRSDLNSRSETIKLLKDDIQETFQDIVIVHNFLDKTQQKMVNKRKTKEMGL